MKTSTCFILLAMSAYVGGCTGGGTSTEKAATTKPSATAEKGSDMSEKVVKTDAEWREQLTPMQYKVTRQEGTEPAFTGKYVDNHEHGVYTCVCCGLQLFSSDAKFDSKSGWPSFYQPIADGSVAEERDTSLGMVRTEVHCPRCGAHLGHVFDDGPRPTGLRYCINSASLDFTESQPAP